MAKNDTSPSECHSRYNAQAVKQLVRIASTHSNIAPTARSAHSDAWKNSKRLLSVLQLWDNLKCMHNQKAVFGLESKFGSESKLPSRERFARKMTSPREFSFCNCAHHANQLSFQQRREQAQEPSLGALSILQENKNSAREHARESRAMNTPARKEQTGAGPDVTAREEEEAAARATPRKHFSQRA